MDTETRIMVIVWRWTVLQNKGKRWKFFPVQDTNSALIILVNENEIDENLISEIWDITSNYPNPQVFWFVHRSIPQANFLVEQINLNKIVKHNENYGCKCFLFSGGSDQIYFSTNNYGLLSDGFYDFYQGEKTTYYLDENGKEYGLKEVLAVYHFDERIGHREILPIYFNRTWHYYEHEFRKKIYALQIDLLSHFVVIPDDGRNEIPFQYLEWRKKLKENNLLYLRIRSFLNFYKEMRPDIEGLPLEVELHNLCKFEEEHEISYQFDDCLIHLKNAKTEYQILSSMLMPIFEENNTSNLSLKIVKRQFRNLLDKLI